MDIIHWISHIYFYVLGFITNMSKTNHYLMGFLHNQTNTEKGFWRISYFFIGNRMNLSVVFIIFLKEVCKVHTLFVVFYNIPHKTVRYEVMKLQTRSVWDSNGWYLVVLSQHKAYRCLYILRLSILLSLNLLFFLVILYVCEPRLLSQFLLWSFLNWPIDMTKKDRGKTVFHVRFNVFN